MALHGRGPLSLGSPVCTEVRAEDWPDGAPEVGVGRARLPRLRGRRSPDTSRGHRRSPRDTLGRHRCAGGSRRRTAAPGTSGRTGGALAACATGGSEGAAGPGSRRAQGWQAAAEGNQLLSSVFASGQLGLWRRLFSKFFPGTEGGRGLGPPCESPEPAAPRGRWAPGGVGRTPPVTLEAGDRFTDASCPGDEALTTVWLSCCVLPAPRRSRVLRNLRCPQSGLSPRSAGALTGWQGRQEA